MITPPAYAELHCTSNFSFLRGASHPEELVARASALGYAALAITDECSLAGAVRAHLEAASVGLPLIIGAAFTLREAFDDPHGRLVLLAQNRTGYGNLSALITRARMRADKGHYLLLREDLDAGIDGCIALLIPSPVVAFEDADARQRLETQAAYFRDRFPTRFRIGVTLLLHGWDAALLDQLRRIGDATDTGLVAAGDVQYHLRSRKTLHDTLAAIRQRRPVAELGCDIAPNAEQHLRSRLRLAGIYPAELLAATVEVAATCRFSLNELRYEYPREVVPEGWTPDSWLRHLTGQGAARRYPHGLPDKVRQQLDHELALIAELGYEPYFLTVADIVSFAREHGILCQGRGSAANSAVCYCLGITEVDPDRINLLFERFISRERNEPPDIDVDFEHHRREEIIQYLYARYGRERAALTASVITYRPRSALRDVGRALGIDTLRIDALSRSHQWWDGSQISLERLGASGFDTGSPVVRRWVGLANALMRFPRHLSQHSGGFVISQGPLTHLVPVENAAMPERSVIQWDKDDLDALGILKVDILALGMLSAIQRALALITERRTGTANGRCRDGRSSSFQIAHIPEGDAATYRMIANADTVGVFQIESRAQMSMLPRLRPACFYDLVIEVAIVRPGPIQGGMVHPYLRRRQGLEAVVHPDAAIRCALERTLGVPIFQEQVMQIAILAAGFSPGEADQLRRAMAAWRRKGGIEQFKDRVIGGMCARGYARDFAESVFRQMQGFGEYGFPESHAASFALLVYVSSWIKCHEPAAFLAALLDSQPMGFYAPAQLVRDARAHGVEIRPVDVLISDWHASLEEPEGQPAFDACGQAPDTSPIDPRPQPAVRLGLKQVKGFGEANARRLLSARASRLQERCDPSTDIAASNQRKFLAFDSVDDLARCAGLDRPAIQALANAGALSRLAGHRARAHWEAAAVAALPGVLAGSGFTEPPAPISAPHEASDILADYASTGIPMGRHPVALLRSALNDFRVVPSRILQTYPDGRLARASGLVTHRQRPDSAKGTMFVTLEDDTGTINVIAWPDLVERYRREILGARLMTVYGVWQRDAHTGGQVAHLVARRIVDHSMLLGGLQARSRDFR